MNRSLNIDLTEQLFERINQKNQNFEKIYQTEIAGRGILHGGHSACEYKEHYCQQHGIVVHLQSEHNSLRRLGDRVEVENVNVGDVAIIPEGVNHWQRIESEASEAIILTIEPKIITHFAREKIRPEKVELLPTFAQSDPLIYGIALNLKTLLDGDSYDKLYAESLYNTLFFHIIRNYCTVEFKLEAPPNGLAPYKLKQVIELINDNLDEEITIEQMAGIADLSLSYFSRQFKLSTGLTPHQYVMQQRLDKAKTLLKDRRFSLANIATDCGFTHQSHMGKLFKQNIGMTPKQYRDEFR